MVPKEKDNTWHLDCGGTTKDSDKEKRGARKKVTVENIEYSGKQKNTVGTVLGVASPSTRYWNRKG